MDNKTLQTVDHLAIAVSDISRAVHWYTSRFSCELVYQDATWALLRFANINLALVLPEQHPPHLGIIHPEAEKFGPLATHRDGTRSVYVQDSEGNHVEFMAN
ncbi:MAG: VOC family protein [Gammaproteobacteria bacterium]|nr:VOC family protein [Gammaproteobacteria bacterium]